MSQAENPFNANMTRVDVPATTTQTTTKNVGRLLRAKTERYHDETQWRTPDLF